MLKKIISFISLFSFLLVSCESGYQYQEELYKEQKVEVLDKYTAVESKYNWWLETYKTYTAYYFVLENGDVKEVSKEEYAKYQVGDLFTIKERVEE